MKTCTNCGTIPNRGQFEGNGLCNACYKYVRRTGKPRPPELFMGRVTQAYFMEEWHFMTVTMGMDEEAAKHRLAEAFGIELSSVQNRLWKNETQKVAA